jgi:hypothetical protein
MVAERFVTIAYQNILELEERLYIALDVAERHRLLQLFLKELAKVARDVEFATFTECRIADNSERCRRQRELVARLKHGGCETSDAYFQLVTLKTMAALFGYHRALARKILVCVVPRSN